MFTSLKECYNLVSYFLLGI